MSSFDAMGFTPELAIQLLVGLPRPIIVLELDPEGVVRLIAVNVLAEKESGVPMREQLGQPMRQIIPSTRENIGEICAQILAGGVPVLFGDSSYLGGKDIFSVTALPLSERRLAIFLENVTAQRAAAQNLSRVTDELMRAESQLRHVQRVDALGRLAGGVAHDFNNMLAVILSYSSFLLSDMPEEDPRRDDLMQIQHAGQRASTLTRQLLAFSRQQVLKPRALDLNVVVAGLEKMLQRLIGADIELAVKTSSRAAPVHADPGQLEQVILNLILNARDAMPSGGRLTVETARVMLDDAYVSQHLGARPGPHIMLAVTDTGQGIPSNVMPHIFEPFFTTKDPTRGTGLGLSTVFGVVKQSGGDIWVYSEPGIGTTFKVYLPELLEDKTTPTTKPPEMLPIKNNDETILLVEDDPLVRGAVRSSLQRVGFIVMEASTPEEARLLCDRYSGRIHLMVSDMVLPRVSGPVLAAEVVKKRPETKVLFMSGYTDTALAFSPGTADSPVAGRLESTANFIQKPFSPAALSRKVREILDTKP